MKAVVFFAFFFLGFNLAYSEGVFPKLANRLSIEANTYNKVARRNLGSCRDELYDLYLEQKSNQAILEKCDDLTEECCSAALSIFEGFDNLSTKCKNLMYESNPALKEAVEKNIPILKAACGDQFSKRSSTDFVNAIEQINEAINAQDFSLRRNVEECSVSDLTDYIEEQQDNVNVLSGCDDDKPSDKCCEAARDVLDGFDDLSSDCKDLIEDVNPDFKEEYDEYKKEIDRLCGGAATLSFSLLTVALIALLY